MNSFQFQGLMPKQKMTLNVEAKKVEVEAKADVEAKKIKPWIEHSNCG